MTTKYSARILVGIVTAGSALMLASAYTFQAFGYAPCHLCLLQRWPHMVAVGIGLLILILRLPAAFALLGAAAALTTTGLGIYHSLVERKIIAGPQECTSAGPGQMSAADLLQQIQNTPLIRCDDISWSFLGMTMANLNAIGSLVLALIWISAFIRARKDA